MGSLPPDISTSHAAALPHDSATCLKGFGKVARVAISARPDAPRHAQWTQTCLSEAAAAARMDKRSGKLRAGLTNKRPQPNELAALLTAPFPQTHP
jgi:hypothetical protein